MKILKVAFENVNSLAGAWEIDFSSDDFRDGLFLIAGDTGAGKTSILDAITLALFGRTARVEISGEHNEVMTRGRRTCRAEVVFACAKGTYRARWSQSRTGQGRGVDAATGRRKAANKPFSPVKRSLARLMESGVEQEIPGTATEIQDEIKTLTGISSFDQFLRTAMLAQGKFDQFLAAGGKEADKNRSAILEQATGTEIYSRIGAAIHSRCQAAAAAVERKSAQLQGAQAMDAETRAAKEAEVAGLRAKAKAAEKLRDALAAEDAWHREAAKLKAENAALARQEDDLKNGEALLTPRLNRAGQARKARRLTADFERRRAAAKASEEAARDAAERAAAEKRFEEAAKKAKADASAADIAAAEAEKDWNRRRDELEAGVDAAEKAWHYARQIATYAEARARLKDGEECPLCGSRSHPLCKGQAPKPDVEKNALDEAKRRLKSVYGKAQTAAKDLLSAKAGLAAAQANLGNALAERSRATAQARSLAEKAENAAGAFLALCREAGFADETEWRAACWDEREIERTEREKRRLDDSRAMLKARKDDWLERRAAFEGKTPSTRTAESVAAELAAAADERKRLAEDALRLEGELKADAQQRERAAALAAELEGLRVEAARWTTLDRELGGDRGANFKLYAQGVTLSNLIEIGNEYLSPMTNGRYIMVWDADGPDAAQLLPAVVDLRAGGERRPVANLSGGERFQVSLALALGLSRLNAGTLNVETLFLDEGFGTLDEQTLDVSISTLENLQRIGAKTIGIISHVKELEDRIATQILARKTGNGLSVLSGAGVSECKKECVSGRVARGMIF